jgi:hypothetical protein
VYARTIGDRTLTFGVSGMLWRDNLIMYDRQTDSWWAQATGGAIQGTLKGSTLTAVPSEMMTWKQWRDLHPGTLVLAPPGGSTRGSRDQYASYHSSNRIGVTGRTRFAGDADPKARIIGFRTPAGATAIFLDALKRTPVLTAGTDAGRVVIVALPDRSTARAFLAGAHEFEVSREAGGRVWLKDRKTGSEWDGYEGRATSGPPAGQRLTAVPAYVAYWFSWRSFFPDSAVVK